MGSRLRDLATLAAAVLVAAGAPSAQAGPIMAGGFLQFGFGDVGTQATGCDPADPAGSFCIPSSGTPTGFLDAPAWTFTAPGGGTVLTIIDAFLSGDRFEVFDFGVSLGQTSLPGGSVVDCGDDPVDCLALAGMSQGDFSLAAGLHSLTINVISAPDGGGSAYLRIGEAASLPEPGTLLLAALAVAALGWSRRTHGTGRVV